MEDKIGKRNRNVNMTLESKEKVAGHKSLWVVVKTYR
jgi:hypothetical protein